MQPGWWNHVSLSRKISVLFGTAVLMTIGVTLVFPWQQMTALNNQAMLVQAQRVASVVRQTVDLHAPDWTEAQMELQRRWPLLADQFDLPANTPRLVLDGPQTGPGFQRDATERLRAQPDQRYFWTTQRDGRVFRLAMAIRGTPADPHPNVLRGIIDVQWPIKQDAAVWNVVVTLLAGASGAVLAILVFYMVTQRLVLSPVHTLRRVAERVTTGDIDTRASIKSGDEFEQLADAFNDMLTHLKRAQEEQEKINRSLDIRIDELAETNVSLYESNRIKSEFLANVTHELRTPLVSIIGFAELLRDAREDPKSDRKRLARYTQHILTSGRNLLDIINDLLDLAKIEAGRLELHLSEFSLAELCSDMIDFVRPLADKRNQTLALSLGEELPRCRSDSGKLKQILYNLLSNAVKFTPTGGSVSLDVRRDGADRVRLSVRDTGPGIPQQQRAIIFEKFRQLDSSQTREHEGTGLGLAITRDLVGILGGVIQLESTVGRGSTFIVDLPLAITDEAEKRRSSPIRLT